MTWIIIIAVIVLFGIWGINVGKKVEKLEGSFNKSLLTEGINLASKITIGTYVGGHPDINKTVTHVFSIKHKNCLKFYAKLYKSPGNINTVYFDHLSDIPIDSIKNISIEDASSIEKKITLGRVLLVGIFALAWKKNKKNKEAFLSIIWIDGKFEHETLFQFENNGAFQEANKVRSQLIKQIQ